jgi:hypothetical protein
VGTVLKLGKKGSKIDEVKFDFINDAPCEASKSSSFKSSNSSSNSEKTEGIKDTAEESFETKLKNAESKLKLKN